MTLATSAKFIAAATLAVAALGATSAAQARANVYVSIGLPGVPVYVEPAPVYVQPQPVYVEPRRVYVPSPAYTVPSATYGAPCPPRYESAYDEERAWRRAEWQRRHWRHHRHDWDRYESRARDWD